MADKRAARRDATQAARKLLQGTLLAAAADLGEAHAGLAQARDGIEAAAARGQELVRQAHEAADRLVAAAREHVAEVEQSYASQWRTAVDAGWTPAQLREMGYTAPASRRRATGTRRSTGEPADDGDPSGPGSVEGAQREVVPAEGAAQVPGDDGSGRSGAGTTGSEMPGPGPSPADEGPVRQDPAGVSV
jgi:hypothetical protein